MTAAVIDAPRTVHLKAAYMRGAMLNGGGNSNYALSDPHDFVMDSASSGNNTRYCFVVDCRRINSNGYGVSALRKPTVRVRERMTVNDKEVRSCRGIEFDNPDKTSAVIYGERFADSVSYQCVERSGFRLDNANGVTEEKAVPSKGKDGYIYKSAWSTLINGIANIYADEADTALWNSFTYKESQDIDIRKEDGTFYTSSKTFTAPKKTLLAGGLAAIEAYGAVTYYQLQWYLLNKELLSPEDAETKCKAQYEWCRETEETE